MPDDNPQQSPAWGNMAGRDFREDIPPSFEWWRKWVYEPQYEDLGKRMNGLESKLDAQSRLLWTVLGSSWIGFISIISVLLTRHP